METKGTRIARVAPTSRASLMSREEMVARIEEAFRSDQSCENPS